MWKEYKGAIIFLIKYVGLYLVLNTAYAFFVESFLPRPDPITLAVSHNAAAMLDAVYGNIETTPGDKTAYVPIQKDDRTIIEVFEGCNSINVVIVYVAFLVAFKGPGKKFLIYLAAGTIAIYFINLLRVIGLFYVALNFPEALYFFHKFLFTGIIYAGVFAGWYFWINAVRKWQPQN